MADEQEDLFEVQVNEEPKGGADSDPVAELNRQFEALKKDNEKRREAEAAANQRAANERAEADRARQEAHAARAVVADRETDTITASIAAANAEAEAAAQEFATAAEIGDWKKQGEAQRKIARAEAKLAQFEATKAELAVRKSETKVEAARPRSTGDPFEDHLTRFTPATASWMREHKDWVTDPRKNSKLVGAHHMAISEGFAPDTDDYFQHVEKTLGIGQPADEDPPPRRNGADNARTQQARRSGPVVAPVNGGAGGHSSGDGNQRRNTVVLTKGERDMAESGAVVWNKGERDSKGEVIKEGDPRIGKPIGVNEYARRKQQLERGGYYDKSYSHG